MSNVTSSLDRQQSLPQVPRHVAVIMDGNGRWARKKGHPRVFGHKYGAERVREIVEQAGHLGVQVLTLYAFSDENWFRPLEEVGAIMHLLEHYLRKERQALLEKNVRFQVIGDLSRLSPHLRKLIEETRQMLSNNDGLTLCVAISYGGRAEIVRAMRRIAEQVASGELRPDDIGPDLISQNLDTAGLPDPDLMIRTSGELRLSNFLLWQSAYTEFYFSEVMWPDFDRYEFKKALDAFGSRERRYGNTNSKQAGTTDSRSDMGVAPC
jgi:undecaprenyl diphosphate synthase